MAHTVVSTGYYRGPSRPRERRGKDITEATAGAASLPSRPHPTIRAVEPGGAGATASWQRYSYYTAYEARILSKWRYEPRLRASPRKRVVYELPLVNESFTSLVRVSSVFLLLTPG